MIYKTLIQLALPSKNQCYAKSQAKNSQTLNQSPQISNLCGKYKTTQV